MRKVLLLLAVILPGLALAQEATEQKDVWEHFRVFVGEWEGTGRGRDGRSKIEAGFRFVLGGNFLEVRRRLVFEPREGDSEGEVREDWGMISYDRNRAKFLYRQYDAVGFVNRFVLEDTSQDGKTLVFITEYIENIPGGFSARATFKAIDDDELLMVWEVAGPDEKFAMHSMDRLKRKK